MYIIQAWLSILIVYFSLCVLSIWKCDYNLYKLHVNKIIYGYNTIHIIFKLSRACLLFMIGIIGYSIIQPIIWFPIIVLINIFVFVMFVNDLIDYHHSLKISTKDFVYISIIMIINTSFLFIEIK